MSGHVTHGHSIGHRLSPEYKTWQNIRRRCNIPTASGYKEYGGRGITVCARWDSFEHFLADMGARPSAAHTIERKDPSLGYSPDNCVWLPKSEQSKNRRNTRWLTFAGETLCMTDWARRLGLPLLTLRNRLDVLGWSLERALTTPRKATP